MVRNANFPDVVQRQLRASIRADFSGRLPGHQGEHPGAHPDPVRVFVGLVVAELADEVQQPLERLGLLLGEGDRPRADEVVELFRRAPRRRRWSRLVFQVVEDRRSPTSVVVSGFVRKSVAPAPSAPWRAFGVTSAKDTGSKAAKEFTLPDVVPL